MQPIANRGFTLIEMMIVVVILAILAAIALPAYNDYVLRSRLTDATNELSAARAKMEQHYLDNRTYDTVGSYTAPCLTNTTAGLFTVSCSSGGSGAGGSLSATGYTIVAQGSGMAKNFTYTIDQAGTKTTRSTKWGTTSNTCWLTRRGDAC